MIHTTNYDKDITVVRPGVQRLTAVNAKAFKDEIVPLVDAGASHLIIDFKTVLFLDSAGLGTLVGVLEKIENREALFICGLNPDVQQMFRICRMDRIFKVDGSLDHVVEVAAENL
jgi:anti-sigma B factor antagonist